MKATLLLLIALPLAACGMREPLAPVAGQSRPPAPTMASRALTTDEMIRPPIAARPGRLDELLQRSEVRHDDRFDLPPGDVPAESNTAAATPR